MYACVPTSNIQVCGGSAVCVCGFPMGLGGVGKVAVEFVSRIGHPECFKIGNQLVEVLQNLKSTSSSGVKSEINLLKWLNIGDQLVEVVQNRKYNHMCKIYVYVCATMGHVMVRGLIVSHRLQSIDGITHHLLL